ncbi:MAG TPA: hypothetical protein PLE45_00780 [Spirochaetota bacterium]|nr:hypothetical protein [Spirochaetota bacterium]HOL56093.1 hypothetical protein [Spirochaetota bacterium]HPP03493.1 hypothetical protein [Spirochaetota bacterium]
MFSINKKEILCGIIVSILYLIVLILSEVIKRVFPSNKEIGRKFAHIGGGIVSLFFPIFFTSYFIPVILCVIFLFVLIITKFTGTLKSVHNVDRDTLGQFFFPFAILLTFILASNKSYYIISILILTFSDSLAALIGKRYGSISINVRGSIKSLEGAIVFIFVTFISSIVSLLLLTDIDRIDCILIALTVSVVVCGAELVSFYGEDNIIIPLSSLLIISYMSNRIVLQNLWVILILVFSITIVFILFLPVKKFKESSLISFMLTYFLILTLNHIKWLYPFLFLNLSLVFFIVLYQKKFNIDYKDYDFIKVLPMTTSNIFLALLNNIFNHNEIFYFIYISNCIVIISIVTYYFSYEIFGNTKRMYAILFLSFVINSFLISIIPIVFYSYSLKYFLFNIIISFGILLLNILYCNYYYSCKKDDFFLKKSSKRWNIIFIFLIIIFIISFILKFILLG